MIYPHQLVFQSPQGYLLTPGFIGKICGVLVLLPNCPVCFFVAIRQVPNAILPLPSPSSQIHVFTLRPRLKGQEYTGEALLVIKGKMQGNKLETRACLNLCLQYTFVNAPLAKTATRPSTTSSLKESNTLLPGERTTNFHKEHNEELRTIM